MGLPKEIWLTHCLLRNVREVRWSLNRPWCYLWGNIWASIQQLHFQNVQKVQKCSHSKVSLNGWIDSMREVSRGVPLNVSLWSSLTDLSNRSEDLTEEAGWKDRCQGGRRGYWQVYHKFFNLVCYSGCKLAQALSPHRRNVLALGTRDVMMALCKLGSWGSSLLTAKSQAFSGICPSWESPSVL